MSGKSKKTSKEDKEQKASNRANKGQLIGGWNEQQIQAAYDE